MGKRFLIHRLPKTYLYKWLISTLKMLVISHKGNSIKTTMRYQSTATSMAIMFFF